MALIITFSSRRIFLCAIDTVSRVFEEGDAYVEEATTSDTQRKERFESDHHDSSSEDGDGEYNQENFNKLERLLSSRISLLDRSVTEYRSLKIQLFGTNFKYFHKALHDL